MLLIPVIDLSAGQVVHAIAGLRESYQKIQSPLCEGSRPLIVIEAMLNLFPFPICYIADLDAIGEYGNNASVISEILQSFPNLTIWLDSGINNYQDILPEHRVRRVLGSESGILPEHLATDGTCARPILSLDFLGNTFKGQQQLLDNSDLWPNEIIVMSLSHVGTDKGPDFKNLIQIRKRAENRLVYAAGGVRNDDDLQTLLNQNITGVLLASAIHHGNISRGALAKYASN